MKSVYQNRFFPIIALVTLLVIAVNGVRAVLYITEIGPWAFSDSAAYLSVARNIVAGKGVVLQSASNEYQLFPLHAPLFPIMTAGLIKLGLEPVQASRWLNAILFGLTIILSGLATWRYTRSLFYAGGVALLISQSIEALRAYSGIMSEGSFLFFSVAALFLAAIGLEPDRKSILIFLLAGIVAGLAILSRYAGLAILPAVILVLLFRPKWTTKKKLQASIVFAVPAILLAAVWFLPVYLSRGTLGDRPLSSVTLLAENSNYYFTQFVNIVSGWLPYFQRGNHILSPASKLFLMVILILLTVFIASVVYKKNAASPRTVQTALWAWLSVAFGICYLLVHFISFVSASTQPDINGRLLLPILLALYLFHPAFLAYIFRGINSRMVGRLLFAVFVYVSLSYFGGRLDSYKVEMHGFGNGYTSQRWQNDAVINAIKPLSPDIPLYSNEPGLVLFHTERFPHLLTYSAENQSYKVPEIPANFALFETQTDPAEAQAMDALISSLAADHAAAATSPNGILFLSQP